MPESLAGDGDFDHGEVGHVVVLVPALLRRPSEDVEGEIGVRLGTQSVLDVVRAEPGFELFDPRFELLFEMGSGPKVRVLWWGRWG